MQRTGSRSSQLDILALEPFYGGARRVMLETVIRLSRHRWTLLKLPPRRIERRLQTAAHWFSEQLSRHWVGRVDVLFTSEALNLADLLRLTPQLARKPSVVYFHDNQLPATTDSEGSPVDFVNLNTAAAASEIWFNSVFHLRQFLALATALVERHPELSSRNPMPELAAKSLLMPPAIDLNHVFETAEKHNLMRQRRTIFVDTRGADATLLNRGLAILKKRKQAFQLITVGPVNALDEDLPRRTVSEYDEDGQIRALKEAGVVLSAKINAPSDHHVIRGMAVGCWPVCPESGVYMELIPEMLQSRCLYDRTPEHLAKRLIDAMQVERPESFVDDVVQVLDQFDATNACRAIDQRLEQITIVHALNSPGGK